MGVASCSYAFVPVSLCLLLHLRPDFWGGGAPCNRMPEEFQFPVILDANYISPENKLRELDPGNEDTFCYWRMFLC